MIDTGCDGGVFTIALNRPSARNAFNREMIRRLRSAIDESDQPSVRVVLIRSAHPEVFSVGMDLEELGGRLGNGATSADLYDLAREYIELLRAIASLRCPTIAAVRGVAIGGGVDLTASCDVALADPSAVFSVAMLRRSIFPLTTSVVLLPRIGEREFLYWIFSGQYYGAAKARQLGLVSEVTRPGRLEPRAMELAARIAAYDARALGLGMDALRRLTSSRARRLDELVGLLALNMQGFRSWTEKRADHQRS